MMTKDLIVYLDDATVTFKWHEWDSVKTEDGILWVKYRGDIISGFNWGKIKYYRIGD